MRVAVVYIDPGGVLNELSAGALRPWVDAKPAPRWDQPGSWTLQPEPDAIVIGVPALQLLTVGRQIKEIAGRIPIILVVAGSTEDHAIEALRLGAADYLRAPLGNGELLACLRRVCGDSPASKSAGTDVPVLIGRSDATRELRAYLHNIAAADCSVLVTGETGTGKELVAQIVHRLSRRSHKPLVCVNCAAIPDTLLESELFGYERGAFTGASAARDGQFNAADGGTIFLDEIGEMTSCAQAKILRAIETKRVQRLGSRHSVLLDVRVVAATNQDLESRVTSHEFRSDLYFRLNVARVHLPPLRNRKEDIPDLLNHFVEIQNRGSGQRVQGFTEETLDYLTEYSWPGNVRELRNIVEASFVGSPRSRIGVADLPAWFFRRLRGEGSLSEKDRLLEALRLTRWNKSRAAQKLNWSRMTVYRKMAQFGISDDEPRSMRQAV